MTIEIAQQNFPKKNIVKTELCVEILNRIELKKLHLTANSGLAQ